MSAHILASDGTALGNPHFYYSRGVGGDDLAIMQDRKTVSRPAGQLWEREAERAEAYYQANGYRYTNQLTLSRSILINLRLSMQALNIEDEKPADLSRHLLNQNYRHLTVTRYDDVTGEPYYEENEAD